MTAVDHQPIGRPLAPRLPIHGPVRPAAWAGDSSVVESVVRALAWDLHHRGLLLSPPSEKDCSRTAVALMAAVGARHLGHLHDRLTAQVPPEVWQAQTDAWHAQLVYAQGQLAARDQLVRGLARRATVQRLEGRGLVATIRRLSEQVELHRGRAAASATLVRKLARRASHQRRRAQALTDTAAELGVGLDTAHDQMGKLRADLAAARAELAAVHAALPDLVQMCATTQGVSLPDTVRAMANALNTLAPGWLVAPTEGGPTGG